MDISERLMANFDTNIITINNCINKVAKESNIDINIVKENLKKEFTVKMLVVCSDNNSIDFKKGKKIVIYELDRFYKNKMIYDIVFINDAKKTNKSDNIEILDNGKIFILKTIKGRFPNDLVGEENILHNFNVIWFAGCNLYSIIYKNTLALKNILKNSNSVIIFTEGPNLWDILEENKNDFPSPIVSVNTLILNEERQSFVAKNVIDLHYKDSFEKFKKINNFPLYQLINV